MSYEALKHTQNKHGKGYKRGIPLNTYRLERLKLYKFLAIVGCFSSPIVCFSLEKWPIQCKTWSRPTTVGARKQEQSQNF